MAKQVSSYCGALDEGEWIRFSFSGGDGVDGFFEALRTQKTS